MSYNMRPSPKILAAPTIIMCESCGDKFHSKWSGQYVSCTCKQSAVDETEEYIRIIGKGKVTEEL
jgi:predicted ATP-dependent serine protease